MKFFFKDFFSKCDQIRKKNLYFKVAIKLFPIKPLSIKIFVGLQKIHHFSIKNFRPKI